MSRSQHQLTKKIRHIRKFFTKDTCQQLIQSPIMSYFNYANAMLSGIPKACINIMQNMQNWAARITIGKQKNRSKNVTEIRWSLHWLPIKERIDFKITTLIHKQPSTHVLTRTHNRKEDKTSRIAFIKSQVPIRSSLYQRMHICWQIIQCIWYKIIEQSSQQALTSHSQGKCPNHLDHGLYMLLTVFNSPLRAYWSILWPWPCALPSVVTL